MSKEVALKDLIESDMYIRMVASVLFWKRSCVSQFEDIGSLESDLCDVLDSFEVGDMGQADRSHVLRQYNLMMQDNPEYLIGSRR